MFELEQELLHPNDSGSHIEFESAQAALESIAYEIAVPEAFLPLIAQEPTRSIQFKQSGAKGIALYENENPIGTLKVGFSQHRDDGLRVVISGEYELICPGSPIRFDYRRIGTKDPVRTQIIEENFLYVKRISSDFRQGPWGYVFLIAK